MSAHSFIVSDRRARIAALLLAWPLLAVTNAALAQEDAEDGGEAPTAPGTPEDPMLEEELRMLEEEVFAEDDPFEEEPYEKESEPGDSEPDAPEEPKPADPKAPTEPVAGLREVTVRYSPEDMFRMGGSVQKLDQEQLAKMQYDDPNAVLLQVPGVYVRQEDGFGLRPNIGLRGTDPNRSAKVTLMEDNVLFGPAPYSAPAAYYFPMMGRISGVEVFKGPAAILYGPQTVAGAINYESRPIPEKPRGQIGLMYGRFQTIRGHLHYGRQNDWGGFIVEGIHLGSAGFKEQQSSFGRDDTGFQRTEASLKAHFNNKLDAHAFNRLTIKFVGSRESSNETYVGLSDEDFRNDPYQRYAGSQLDNMSWWRTAISLRHNLAVGDRVRLETTAYRHDFDRTWERANRFGSDEDGFVPIIDVVTAPNTPPLDSYFLVLNGSRNSISAEDPSDLSQNLRVISNRRRFVVMGVQTRLRADFQTGKVHHEVESGLRFHYDSVDRFQPEQSYSMQNEQLVWNGVTYGEDPNLLINDNRGEAQALAGYLMWGIEVEDLVLKPGLRVEYIRTFFEDEKNAPELGLVEDAPQLVALPGLGLQYTIFEGFAVLAGVHRGFSAVAPGNGNEASPELSINYEAGLRYVTSDSLGFAEVIGFFNDYSNIVSLCSGSSGCDDGEVGDQFNGGRAFIGGVEVLGGYSIPLPRELTMPVRVSYTYTNATYRTTFDNQNPTIGEVQKGDPIDFVPPHLLNAQVGLQRSFWALYTIGSYISPFPEGVVGTSGTTALPDTDGYFVLDIVGRIRFEPVEAYIRFNNVTNTQAIVSRRPFGARPNPPFSVQVGVQVTF